VCSDGIDAAARRCCSPLCAVRTARGESLPWCPVCLAAITDTTASTASASGWLCPLCAPETSATLASGRSLAAALAAAAAAAAQLAALRAAQRTTTAPPPREPERPDGPLDLVAVRASVRRLVNAADPSTTTARMLLAALTREFGPAVRDAKATIIAFVRAELSGLDVPVE
jgi:hypothetical protein